MLAINDQDEWDNLSNILEDQVRYMRFWTGGYKDSDGSWKWDSEWNEMG